MFFKRFDTGYDPVKHPSNARWAALTVFPIAYVLTMFTLFAASPIHPFGIPLNLIETWDMVGFNQANPQIYLRLILSLVVGSIGAWVAYRAAYRNTSLSEPFRQVRNSQPRVYYGEKARTDLRRRLFAESGFGSKIGFYLAPNLPMPRDAETKNIMVIGLPNSGKSNITRALADQAIDRGDRVLLLCNKGDVTASFGPDEAILIAAHHLDSWALDLAVDNADVAAAKQLATDLVPESNPPFWSDSARVVLTDVILALQATRPGTWTARLLLKAALSDSEVIRNGIARILLNAGPMLIGSDPDAEDKAVAGILLTMRSAALANLRPLAWAWDNLPTERYFSVKEWMADDYKGPKTLIVQFSPEYEALSTLVAGNLIARIAKRLADPQIAVDPARRVVMLLDEFHILSKIEYFQTALAVGREKGLVIVIGIQSLQQLIAKYGHDGANLIADLFQIKIYGRHVPGDSAKTVAGWLGERDVSALIENRTPAKDEGKWIEERKTIPTFGQTELASKVGITVNPKKTGDVRAVVHCFGQCYILDWPFTTWRKKREGFIPAEWLTRPPLKTDNSEIKP